MKTRTYPCQLYTLTSNYSVRKVTITRGAGYDSGSGYTARGAYYYCAKLFDTKAAAIKAGRAQIKRRQKNLDHVADSLLKASAALDKAEGAS